jgi:prevent-host-death family protein
MAMINMFEAKSRLSKLVELVESGAEAEIIIARNGKPAARLVPMHHRLPGRRIGLAEAQVALFALADPEKLTAQAHDLIADPQNTVFVSAVSLWEISLKHEMAASGAARMPIDARRAAELFARSGYETLDVTPVHVLFAEGLPALHGDPFDRMLAAQALSEPMRLLTRDRRLAAYSDPGPADRAVEGRALGLGQQQQGHQQGAGGGGQVQLDDPARLGQQRPVGRMPVDGVARQLIPQQPQDGGVQGDRRQGDQAQSPG